ncbi:MAG: ATP-dependent DNA helicase [Methanosarcinales archaeon]|nr:MAG: ATP-dependent DNA helicase [Methanosarcinales archaeon]
MSYDPDVKGEGMTSIKQTTLNDPNQIQMTQNYRDWFPYPSFRPQQDTMLDRVQEVARAGEHRVLAIDAPTGSGKTSVIAALLANRGKNKIVVVLRTVSQIGVYLDEIKKIREETKHTPKVAYLVGKPKMCKLAGEFENVYAGCDLMKIFTMDFLVAKLHEKMRRDNRSAQEYNVYDPASDPAIESEIRGETPGYRTFCPYYLFSKEAYTFEGVENFRPSKQSKKDSESIIQEILYPEELHEHCAQTCPYEVMAISVKGADIIILNYNHVFDDTRRDVLFDWLEINPENTILLIDEAHNLGDTVRSINSDTITMHVVDKAISEVNQLAGEKNRTIARSTRDILSKIKKYMEKTLDNWQNRKQGEDWFDPRMFADFIYSDGGLGLKRDDSQTVSDLLKLAQDIRNRKQKSSESADVFLGRIAEFLFMTHLAKDDSSYLPVKSMSEDRWLALEIRSLDPSPIISGIADTVHATVMISGTLSPPEDYELYYFGENKRAELLSIPNQFPKKNRLVLGAKSATTQAAYRNNAENRREIEFHISALIKGVSGNVAIYFTSYFMMDQYLECCERMTENSGKILYLEPRESKQVPDLLKRFFESGRSMEKGVLLAVCGGKMSEGIDYYGEALKGAIVIGLPLSAFSEVQKLVNTYYQRKYGRDKGMFIAYTLPAINKALQAIGRVHRSADETGVLVFCDARFSQEKRLGVRQHLPEWIQDEMIVCDGAWSQELVEEWSSGTLDKNE